MFEHTPRSARNASHDASNERQRIDAIFTEFLGQFRASQGTAVLHSPPPPVAPKRQPRALPRPEPGWRYLRLIEPPQITTERWTALSRSQIRAARLIRAGSSEQALQALREGTWRNPEEELRKLAIRFPRRRQPDLLASQPTQRATTTPD